MKNSPPCDDQIEINVSSILRKLPKAELHLHLEGTLEPGLMLSLSLKNSIPLPFGDLDAATRAYAFGSLQSFLDIYYAGMSVLRTEEDFHDLTMAYFKRAHDDSVVHAELFFDPQAHTRRGIPFPVVIEGILSGTREATARFGITNGLIMCFLRHLPESDAFATLAAARPYISELLGVGLDSTEIGYPPSLFQRVFSSARELGLHCVAHAGEEGPAAYVTEALNLLKAERIEHGNRAMDDPTLLKRLAVEKIPLTSCPLSNLRLGVIKDLTRHPVEEMLKQGLRVTIGSDDPAYFSGYLCDNYLAVATALSLSLEDIFTLVRNSFLSSFLPDSDKVRLCYLLDYHISENFNNLRLNLKVDNDATLTSRSVCMGAENS